MIVSIIAIGIGIIAAIYMPAIPFIYSKYTAVAIMASLDSVFGGISSNIQGKFNMGIFLSGFFTNALLAAALTLLGERLGADMFIAIIFVFANRIFINFAIIRRYILSKFITKV